MIGIFDSGVGGMTVARAIELALPEKSICYFGDLARSPYGSKSAEAIIRYSRENADFLMQHGSNMLVIACNSAASVSAAILAKELTIPVFEVISPALRQAVQTTQNKKIGIIGTRATIRSNAYVEKIMAIDPEIRVISQPCPLLVPLVEENWLEREETASIIRTYLQPLIAAGIDTLVLGCTHYPLLKPLISRQLGDGVHLIDSAEAVAEQVKNFINSPGADLYSQGKGHHYYVSDITESAAIIATNIFKRDITLIKA